MLEREAFALSVREIQGKFAVGPLLGGLAGRSGLGLLTKGFGLISNYPYVLSALSGLFVRSKFKWVKVVGLAAVGWFAYQGARDGAGTDQGSQQR